MTYLCLSVAAAGLGYMLGVRVMRSDRDWWRKHARAWWKLADEWRDITREYRSIHFDAKRNDRMWQAIQDRLAVDSLVGSATYRGDE